jgi:hypothetical protein
MRYFRHLPPLLRVMSILGLLLPLASIAVLLGLLIPLLTSFPVWPVEADSALGIAAPLSLGLLSGACAFVVNVYTLRFRRPGSGPYPLASWQSQVRWWGALAALPLGALTVAVFLPPTPLLGFVLPLLILLAALVYLAAWVYAADKWHALP